MSRRAVAVVALLCALAACDQSQVVGSRWLKEQLIPAAQGGTVTVAAAESAALAGASLRVAAGDLAADAILVLEASAAPLAGAERQAGPAALWGPAALTFARPVELVLPFTLAAGQSAADLAVAWVDGAGVLRRVERAELVVDEARGLVALHASGLGAFQAQAIHRCSAAVSCPTGLVCGGGGECRTPDAADGGTDGGAGDDAGTDDDGGHGGGDGGKDGGDDDAGRR